MFTGVISQRLHNRFLTKDVYNKFVLLHVKIFFQPGTGGLRSYFAELLTLRARGKCKRKEERIPLHSRRLYSPDSEPEILKPVTFAAEYSRSCLVELSFASSRKKLLKRNV